jgi:hypothetical protein
MALQRVRCAVTRDILLCLKRGALVVAGEKEEVEDADGDMLQVWNDIETQLLEAERALKTDQVLHWDARTLPRTPNDVPIYLSQLSSVPDKGAAFGTCIAFMGPVGAKDFHMILNISLIFVDFMYICI